jgi:hypothetical protein
MIVAINEIVKNPKLLGNSDEIIYIEDKRKKELKSIVIPAKYKDELADFLKEVEYREWLERNKEGLESSSKEFDGLFDEAIKELGDRL